MPQIQPRLIRYRDAPAYCGMDRSMFDKNIRPLIEIEIKDGPKFLAFDRLDLDAALDDYKQRNGKPKEKTECQKSQGFITTQKPSAGPSTNKSTAAPSASAYRAELSKKRS